MVDNEKDAADLAHYQKCQEATGKLDFVHIHTAGETDVLTAVLWSFKGSCDIVKRCGQIEFRDSTHHLTKYVNKLSSITPIDFEVSTKTVLLSLNLHENADSYKRIFVSWHEAFGSRIPRVILIYGVEGMFAAIA